MTEKKEKILLAAQQLFAQEGFDATSTSKVAKAAGVSEGLIFRHFGNKEGLLDAIMKDGEERATRLFADVVLETDPKQLVRKVIDLPEKFMKGSHDYWRLQHILKYRANKVDPEKMEPVILVLSNAFKHLKYKQPELEARMLVTLLEGVVSAELAGTLKEKKKLIKFIKSKYLR